MPLPARAARGLVVLLGLLAAGTVQAQARPLAQPLALEHVLLVTGTDRPPVPDATVVITNGRIAATGPAGTVSIPRGVRRLDLHGRVVIPGLWDMHVHISGPRLVPDGSDSAQVQGNRAYFWPMLLAHGVVGVREMAGRLDVLRAWRREIDHGGALGPHLVITGEKLGHAPVVPSAPWPLRSADDVRASVALLKAGGADFVKIDLPSGRLYRAVVAAAAEAGLPFVGHVPPDLPADSAARLGERSIEHMQGVLLGSARDEAALRRAVLSFRGHRSWWVRLVNRVRGYRSRAAVWRKVVASYDTAKAQRMFQAFRDSGSWQDPTLHLLREMAQRWQPDESFEDSVYAAPAIQRQRWYHRNVAPSPAFDLQLRAVGAMRRAGVGILAGTDTPTAHAIPGESLQDELLLLTRAGLTPLQALQAATRDPAIFLGAADSLGTVEPGKVADLVVLDANPLEDIRNVAKIHAVVRGGRWLGRDTLDVMLQGVRGLLASWGPVGAPPGDAEAE